MTIRALVVVGGVLVATMVGIAGWGLAQIPAHTEIAVHWGFDGQPDGYAPAWLGLLAIPMVAAAVIALLALLPRIDPRRANLERSLTAYVAVGISVVMLLVVLQIAVLVAALGSLVEMLTVALVGVGVLLIVLGNFLTKTRSNWTMGLRTPWTLSSERSWTRTHRLGALLFIADGILAISATGLFGARTAIWVLLGAVGISLVAGVVYSYLVWRDDPARRDAMLGW